VDLLLKENAKIDVRANDGHTALMVAAFKGRLDVVVDLLNAGANVSLVNNEGKTALDFAKDYARKSGNRDIEMLLEAYNMRGTDALAPYLLAEAEIA